jgi:hypothetical protein
MEEKEIWKDVKGWEGLYQVSNLGRVKSLPMMHNAIHPYITKEIILRPRVCGKDREYLSVSLNNNGYIKQKRIHILVAEAFIPNPNNYTEINHKDENKGNNFVFVNEDGSVDYDKSNLEWCSRSYNVNYGNRAKKYSMTTGKRVMQYTIDGEFVNEFISIGEASLATGINTGNICRCCKGKLSRTGIYFWKYKE